MILNSIMTQRQIQKKRRPRCQGTTCFAPILSGRPTGSSDDHGHHTHIYGGAGSASSVTTNGNLQTAFSATVSESGSDQGTYDYKTKAKYAGSGWTESGSGTASASVIATSIYNDKIVTTFASSSGGPNGSSQSHSKDTATHFEKQVGSSGFAEHYELLSDGWFMDSRAAAGADSDNKALLMRPAPAPRR